MIAPGQTLTEEGKRQLRIAHRKMLALHWARHAREVAPTWPEPDRTAAADYRLALSALADALAEMPEDDPGRPELECDRRRYETARDRHAARAAEAYRRELERWKRRRDAMKLSAPAEEPEEAIPC